MPDDLIQIPRPELGRPTDPRIDEAYIAARPELSGVTPFDPETDVDLVGVINDKLAEVQALGSLASGEAQTLATLATKYTSTTTANPATPTQAERDAYAAAHPERPWMPGSRRTTDGGVQALRDSAAGWVAEGSPTATGAQVQAVRTQIEVPTPAALRDLPADVQAAFARGQGYGRRDRGQGLSRDPLFLGPSPTLRAVMDTGSHAAVWVRAGRAPDADHSLDITRGRATWHNTADVGVYLYQAFTGWSVGSRLRLTAVVGGISGSGTIAGELRCRDAAGTDLPNGLIYLNLNRTGLQTGEVTVPAGTAVVAINAVAVGTVDAWITRFEATLLDDGAAVVKTSGAEAYLNKSGRRHVRDYGASGSSYLGQGAMTAGQATLTLAEVGDWQVGQGVAVQGAGAACTLAAPSGLAAYPYGAAGSRTISVKIAAMQAGGGVGPAAELGVANLPTTFSRQNYAKITWNAVAGATAYAVYVDGWLMEVTTRPLVRLYMNFRRPGNLNVPQQPGAGQANILLATVTGGAGTITLTLDRAATTSASGSVIHDDTAAFQRALDATPVRGELWADTDDIYHLGALKFRDPVYLKGKHHVLPLPTLGPNDSIYTMFTTDFSPNESYRSDGIKAFGGIEYVMFGNRDEYRTVPIRAAIDLTVCDWIEIGQAYFWGLLGSALGLGEPRESRAGTMRAFHCGDGTRRAVWDLYGPGVGHDQPNILQFDVLELAYSLGIPLRADGPKTVNDPTDGGGAVRMLYIKQIQVEGSTDQWNEYAPVDWDGLALKKYDHSIVIDGGSIGHENLRVDGLWTNVAGVHLGDSTGMSRGKVTINNVLHVSGIPFILDGAKDGAGGTGGLALTLNGGVISPSDGTHGQAAEACPKTLFAFGATLPHASLISQVGNPASSGRVRVGETVEYAELGANQVIGDDGAKVEYGRRSLPSQKPADPYASGQVVRNVWGVSMEMQLTTAPKPSSTVATSLRTEVDRLGNGSWDFVRRDVIPAGAPGWGAQEFYVGCMVPRGAAVRVVDENGNGTVAFGAMRMRTI